MPDGMEARRIVCHGHGHTVAMLKTHPGIDGDDFADSVIKRYGCCIYCGDTRLAFEREPLAHFESWAHRDNGTRE